MARLAYAGFVLLGACVTLCFGKRQAQAASVADVQHPNDGQDDLPNSTLDLGVRMIRPVYARVPRTVNGRVDVTVVLTIWLKRVGARGAPYDMPHQAQVNDSG
jgi:hypothetical protein